MSKKVLRLPDVINRTGIPRSTIYHLIKQQKFPTQINLSQRSVAWLESDIDTWIEGVVKSALDAKGVK